MLTIIICFITSACIVRLRTIYLKSKSSLHIITFFNFQLLFVVWITNFVVCGYNFSLKTFTNYKTMIQRVAHSLIITLLAIIIWLVSKLKLKLVCVCYSVAKIILILIHLKCAHNSVNFENRISFFKCYFCFICKLGLLN